MATTAETLHPLETVQKTVNPRPPLAQTLKPPLVQPSPPKQPALPPSLKLGFTGQLEFGAYLHALIFGEYGMRKTTIACSFDAPEHTLVLMTRRPEQLLPVRDFNFPYVEITDAAALQYALIYPEALWGLQKQQNAGLKELRTLVLDDVTEGVTLLLESAKEDLEDEAKGREVKNQMRVYMRGKSDLRDVIKVVLRKPLNFIATAVARKDVNSITGEEQIGPDVSQAMAKFLGAEFEFLLYVRPQDYRFTTDRDTFVFKDVDMAGNERTYKRIILAKNKLPVAMARAKPPIIALYEDADLRTLWSKVQQASRKK